jgi:homoserine O-succinyltransferase/O-acetyltransferase
MPLVIEPRHSGIAAELRGRGVLTIGLVNNMPDAAVEATERQFAELIRAASSDVAVRLKLFWIPEVPRVARVRDRLGGRYRDISELWEAPIDALIVTGTEPRAAALTDEPYWPAFRQLIAWARDNTASTIWSCLAAQAAVLEADGIERQALPDKLFGVFDCEAVAAHPLTRAARPPLSVPHSRYNDLPESALIASGYDVLTRSAATGVDAFVRAESDRSLFVFFQGHPEYEADTLAREYRRDIGRFLRGERDRFPAAPQGYFKGEAAALVDRFCARAVSDAHEGLIADFPMLGLEASLANTWRRFAVEIYRNWMTYLKERSAGPRTFLSPPRRFRRNARSTGGAGPPVERSAAR